MKNRRFLFFTTGLSLLVFFYSCKKSSDVNSSPVIIYFNNTSAVDSVFDGDTYTLKGAVLAKGSIQSIRFFRSFPFNAKQDEVEMAATAIKDTTADTCNFSVDVPNITYQTIIKVVVTQQGHQTSAVYTINSGRITNITTQANKWCGGWNSPLYGNFYSIINNTAYGYSTETKHPELIPLCAFYFGDYKVGATDIDYPAHKSTVGFSDMGTRFAMTSFTTAQFDAMRSDDSFKSLSDPTLLSIGFDVSNVILFKTKAGKLGLLKIIVSNSEEDYNFDVKVQQ